MKCIEISNLFPVSDSVSITLDSTVSVRESRCSSVVPDLENVFNHDGAIIEETVNKKPVRNRYILLFSVQFWFN